ncbi:Mediator of RNA polymerase II transcription subunit 18 [Monascus purpureus]|uniref:Mediator of RNA polymerase II transcription subunit 18 n=1 Tax=Monascus purpureus TaxID=5098 RepID=A0A507QKJ8_MONPU|nr:Mediator of RNA polymerase II transcription subunit 18 [Monascus purpureus]BDD60588.1 Mediator of RNA polymerase II transcription subunit 18 [Monascus purpureus]
MHELLLFASVPLHQHHELLQQLAGLTAMQPRHCLERRLVFKAYRKPGVFSLRTGASQDVQPVEMQRLNKMLNGNIFYTQLAGPVSEGDFGSTSPSPEDQHQDQDISMTGMGEGNQVDHDGRYDYDYDRQPWRLEFRDTPEAATRSAVTSRLMSSASLPRGDVMAPMNAWGYSFVTEYVVEGDIFVYDDIVLFLHRVLQYPSSQAEHSQPRRQLPSLEQMAPLDKSGSYVLQAAITVQDGGNQETMETASQHLLGLRERLRTAVRLEPADRLSLDSRAK